MPREDAPPAGATKNEFRTWARAIRSGLRTRQFSGQITAHIAASPLFERASHVLIYMALPDEVDLSGLTASGGAESSERSRFENAPKTYYLTRTGDEFDSLSVHRLDPERLERHRFGFLQPLANSEAIDPSIIDLALIPGLAFDVTGARLGFGHGYYDRLLFRLPPLTPRVGVAPSELVVERLPSEPHDVAMTHLVTESGLTAVRPGSQDQDRS